MRNCDYNYDGYVCVLPIPLGSACALKISKNRQVAQSCLAVQEQVEIALAVAKRERERERKRTSLSPA